MRRHASSRLRAVCATANPAKVVELQSILGDDVELLPRPMFVPAIVEDSGTLLGNARLKAEAVAVASTLPAIADDTGLEVDALGGAPGVETATLAGIGASAEDNRTKLLGMLDGTVDRRARFRTIAMVCWPDGAELWAEGVCAGEIATKPRGTGGFGYDRVFVPANSDGRTFAEMSAKEKEALSHRGKAFTALLALLSGAGPGT